MSFETEDSWCPVAPKDTDTCRTENMILQNVNKCVNVIEVLKTLNHPSRLRCCSVAVKAVQCCTLLALHALLMKHDAAFVRL